MEEQARRPIHSARDVQALVWPIIKRIPAYLKLAWALGREPAIPKRHKALLVSAAIYAMTPAQAVVALVPVIGQIDSIVLFLLGLRQALAHCPPRIAQRRLRHLGLRREQLDEDLATILYVARSIATGVGRSVGRDLRFAGRVARGFGRRMVRRLLDEAQPESA